MIVEGIGKDNRLYFKKNVKRIHKSFIVLFKGDNATIKLIQPFNISEEWLIDASIAKKALNIFIHDFRRYQFNN